VGEWDEADFLAPEKRPSKAVRALGGALYPLVFSRDSRDNERGYIKNICQATLANIREEARMSAHRLKDMVIVL